MSKADRDARVVQDATGARYTTCLRFVRVKRTEGPAAFEDYMSRVDDLADLLDGQERCLTCLRWRHDGEACKP